MSRWRRRRRHRIGFGCLAGEELAGSRAPCFIERMTLQRLYHVGVVVFDLAAATEFFVGLGILLQGERTVEGGRVDRAVGLEGVRAEIAILQTPDGNGRLELTVPHAANPGRNRHAPANTPGIRHVAFAVENIDAVVAGLRARGAESSASWSATRPLPPLLLPRPRGNHRRAVRADRTPRIV